MSNYSSRGREIKKTKRMTEYRDEQETREKRNRAKSISSLSDVSVISTNDSAILTPVRDLHLLKLYETPLNLSNLQVFSPFPYTPSNENRGIITPGTNSFLRSILNDCEL